MKSGYGKDLEGIKEDGYSNLKGLSVYHNYIREHSALNGQTLAEKCGIKIEGNNKWNTLIENASNK